MEKTSGTSSATSPKQSPKDLDIGEAQLLFDGLFIEFGRAPDGRLVKELSPEEQKSLLERTSSVRYEDESTADLITQYWVDSGTDKHRIERIIFSRVEQGSAVDMMALHKLVHADNKAAIKFIQDNEAWFLAHKRVGSTSDAKEWAADLFEYVRSKSEDNELH